jgi:hypothetical protein
MEKVDIYREVSNVVEERFSNGLSAKMAWITQEVVQQHPDISGADTDFYRTCAYEHVRAVCRDFLRRFDLGPVVDPQIELPGFKGVQKAYTVKRDGEQEAVRTDLLTVEEVNAKIDELSRMMVGCQKHTLALTRYRDERFFFGQEKLFAVQGGR